MGSISLIIVENTFIESKEERVLWELNKMREHDCRKPYTKLPKGIKFERIKDYRPMGYIQNKGAA